MFFNVNGQLGNISTRKGDSRFSFSIRKRRKLLLLLSVVMLLLLMVLLVVMLLLLLSPSPSLVVVVVGCEAIVHLKNGLKVA